MRHFVYETRSPRVVFGNGRVAQLGAELRRMGSRRVLLFCTASRRLQALQVTTQLGERVVAVFEECVMHVPAELAKKATALAKDVGADTLLAVGGGSTIGFAKAVALDTDLAIVAVPTTYSGSEMTSVFGITREGVKQTGRDDRVLPRVVIYDPELTVRLPVATAVTSGMNAIAHAVEGLYGADANPMTDVMAQEGIKALADALPVLTTSPGDLEARSQALYGGWLCGMVLNNVGMGLHHKLCHTLGGSFNLPHAETHAVILPHALAYNAPCASDAVRKLAAALGTPEPQVALHALARRCGAPTSLRELGMKESDLDRACDLALANEYPNPRPLEREGIRSLLQRAFQGAVPEVLAAGTS